MRATTLTLALFLFVSSALAETPIHGSVMLSNIRSTGDNQILESPVPVDLAVTSGPGFGLAADATFRGRYVAELGFHRLRPDVELRALGFALDAGSLNMEVATLSFLTTLGRADARVQPYLGAGVLYATFGDIDAGALGFAIVDEELQVEPAFGASIGGGIRAAITPRLALFGDARYFPVEAAIERAEAFPVDIDLNPLVLSLGLRLRLR